MKLAIMQPYFFPYIGYFQLINAVDKFVFYDDVNFIKNGWINRNRILLNGQFHYFTVQLKNAGSFKIIKEVEFTDNRSKLQKTLEQAYKKAPYYNVAMPILIDCLNYPTNKISELAIYSVKRTSYYLGINAEFENSSVNYYDTKGLEKAERISQICKINNAGTYINPIGGQEIYKKEQFLCNKINLFFIQSNSTEYKQYNDKFIPDLSVIDVMMFNSKEKICEMLNQYELK
jgi:hypothetical protein